MKTFLKNIFILWMLITAGVTAQAATVTPAEVTEVYVATFDRAPDADGLKYWVNSGLSIEEIAESFFAQPETQKKYPDSTPTKLFIREVYQNMFNRQPEEAGLAYWAEALEEGRVSRGKFILALIRGAQDTGYGKDKSILANKTAVGLYYAEEGLNDLDLAKRVMQGVTASSSTVTRAKQQIDQRVNPYPVGPVKPQNCPVATTVIGQPDMTSTAWAGNLDEKSFSGGTLSNPFVVDGHLYTGDSGFSRVMGWDSIPTANGESADFVLGQNDFVSKRTGQNKVRMWKPRTAASTEGKFFVADTKNNRILGYNSIPVGIGTAADFVIGQKKFGNNVAKCKANRLSKPVSIFAVDGKLIIADRDNNRVLIYNSIPAGNNAPADLVLGQANMTTGLPNRGGVPAAHTLNKPKGVWSDGKRLVVNDSRNNRVLIWNTFPTVNGQPADVVLGQSDFSHAASNDDDQDGIADLQPSARTANDPRHGVYSNGKQLFVADTLNNRVLVWDRFPTKNFTPANRVFGQCDFDTNTPNGPDAGVSARGLNFPSGVFVNGQNRVIVTDQNNARVLIYKK